MTSAAAKIEKPKAVRRRPQQRTPRVTFTEDQIQLLKDSFCKGATDDEFKLFIEVCKRRGLDPFLKQIHPVKRWDSSLKREVMAYQVGIDGFRLTAERSGEYEGQTPQEWCGPDGRWVGIWLGSVPPSAARCGVYRKGFREPLYATALLSSYQALKKDGNPNAFWVKMPELMLHKCAEAMALRKAFPGDLSGFYVAEELEQMSSEHPPITGEVIEAAMVEAAAKAEPAPKPVKAMPLGTEMQGFIERCEMAGTYDQLVGMLDVLSEFKGKEAEFAKRVFGVHKARLASESETAGVKGWAAKRRQEKPSDQARPTEYEGKGDEANGPSNQSTE